MKEYLVKGFTLNNERLKDPEGGRYFEERSCPHPGPSFFRKIFWRKVLDIYSTSIDYDLNAETSQMLFRQVQNKMRWAAHGHTAAEPIYRRPDAGQPNIGITNYPGNKLLKRDVEVAKNYLSEDERSILNRIVSAYLELAEIQALNRLPMTMQDWAKRLNQFLKMSGWELPIQI